MTLAFIDSKLLRRFITLQSVRIFQVIVPSFGMFNTVVVLREKKFFLYLTDYVLLRKFSNDSERCEQVSIILSSVSYRRVYLIYYKKSRFIEDVLFYPKNGVMAFPKVEIIWDWVSDVHVYISLTRKFDFDNIVVREPVKHLRIKLPNANVWCKQTQGSKDVSYGSRKGTSKNILQIRKKIFRIDIF